MDIYKLVLNMAQVQPDEVLYIDDTAVFIAPAESMGIKSICQIDYESTCKKLQSLDLKQLYEK